MEVSISLWFELSIGNYFYYQLSHDNAADLRYLVQHRKLRRSPLATDLAQVNKR